MTHSEATVRIYDGGEHRILRLSISLRNFATMEHLTHIFSLHLLLITNLLQDYNLNGNTHKPLTDVLNNFSSMSVARTFSWLDSGQADGSEPCWKKRLPSLTSNQPESLRRVCVSVYVSLSNPSTLCQTVSTAVGKKQDQKQQQRNNWFPVSTPPPPLSLFSIRQDPNDFHSPLSSPSISTPHLPNSFILPKPPPVLCCGFFPPCLYFRSLPFFWPNWNCSLWNGKVIYIDSRGIWLAVLSGATCNVTGNKATTNILPPPLSAAKSPPGQRVTSNRNLEKVKVCQEAIVNFCWPFFFPSSTQQFCHCFKTSNSHEWLTVRPFFTQDGAVGKCDVSQSNTHWLAQVHHSGN